MNENIANYSIQDDEHKPLIASPIKQTLPFFIKLVYGFPSLPLSLSTNFVTTYIFFYYTDSVGVPLELLNQSYIITLFFLLFFFPVLGWFFDITNTRFGRRRPYLIFGAPALYLVCIIVWIPPSSFPHFLTKMLSLEMLYCLWYSVWYGAAMIITYVVQTPYIALGVEMTSDFEERSSLYSYSQAFYVIGMIMATGVPELGLKYYSNAKNLFFYLSLVSGILGVLSFEFMCWIIHERPDYIRKESTPLVSGIRAAFLENKPFVVLLIVITLQNSAPYTLSLLPYWVQYTLELNDLWGFIMITTFIATGFLFIPFWNIVAKLWGKRKAYAFACIFGFFGYGMMMIPGPGQITFALISCVVSGASGMFLTNSNFLYQSLQGDCMDYDEFRTGLRREALYSNIMQFFNWYMSMFSTSAPFLVLQMLGFNADQAQTRIVRIGLGGVVGSSGLFALAAGVVLLAFYPITKQKYLLILSGIKQHEMGHDVKDMFSSQTIPAPNKMSEDSRDKFWLLYSFSHWELKHPGNLIKITFSYVVFWSLIFAGGAVGWHFNYQYYYIWAYLALLALYMVAYHVLRLRAAIQVKNRGIKNQEIEDYLSYKMYL